MISVKNVSKHYGDHQAVRDLSFEVHQGEIFACLGPNGAGKTTTIKMITGLLRPTRGTIEVAGRPMIPNNDEARRSLGYVPDEPHLYEKLSAREFLEFTGEVYGLDPDRSNQDMESLIDRLELGEFVDELAETYSHGMRQRVVFASALLPRPPVLLVDEPMVGLDPRSMRIVKDLLKERSEEGTTIFMSTHTLTVAEELADRIAIFSKGRMIASGTTQSLRAESASTGSLEDIFLQLTAEAQADS